ncbi:hypothetical protein GCM10010168_51420 [Actinoplanes ianthinogenes]|uniref:ARB-07466-like C-terminal domain-containing protein n=1 Tax=Actinoplanes ianthinogenes TaxID=122358 RepID=A0ABM7M3G2_9ACTN|nr:hypothetical protein [Actinoplanes ianthinogenes]BCJ46193.1 hypothetical protein Aiant_68500 [Actinoplanes ianthinogenes]GGR26945.1 hypothetical protein GCM10010168_51420 [Actinoplanes ianthinogenes]
MKTFLAATLAGVLVLMLALSLGDDPAPAAASDATSCLTATGETPHLDDEQTGNAARIIAIGKQRGIAPRGWAVAVATAMQESSLRNINHGDRDSVGLFQQRPSMGWGTVEQLTDVDYATNAFYGGPPPPDNGGLLDVPGWERMELTDAAQAVQRSGTPQAYANWTALAIDLVREHGGVELDCAKVVAGPGSVEPAPRNPDGSWPHEGCVIKPDPTTGRGCLTPRTDHIVKQAAAYGKPGCWRPSDHGEHPKGRACDWMMTSGGEAHGEQKAKGDSMAAWAVANADKLGIMYVIWYRRIWTPERGWHDYNNPWGGNDPSGWHTNHVHISMY